MIISQNSIQFCQEFGRRSSGTNQWSFFLSRWFRIETTQ